MLVAVVWVYYEALISNTTWKKIQFKGQLNLRDTQDGSGWPGLCTQLYKYAIVKWYPLGSVAARVNA